MNGIEEDIPGATRARNEPGETWYDLPAYIEPPIEVFLNGVRQEAGVDFSLQGQSLVFPRELRPDQKLTRFQWALGVLGIAGTYTKHDTLDIVFTRNGKRLVKTGLSPRPTADS